MGDIINSSFPFTAPSNGLLNVVISPETGSTVSTLSIKNSDDVRVSSGNSSGGASYSMLFPVYKGKIYRIDVSENVSTKNVMFTPLF